MSSTKRRAKAIRRRRWVNQMLERWDLRLARVPADVQAVSYCGCGGVMWLQQGASPEDRQAFDQDVADHDYHCAQAVPA